MKPFIARSLIAAFAVIVFPAAAIAADSATSGKEVKNLHALFDADWQRTLRENPLQASDLGDHRYDDQWGDVSLAAQEREHQEVVDVLKKLGGISRAGLPPEEQLNYDLFKQQHEDSLQSYAFHEYLRPLDHIYGIQSVQDILEELSFDTPKDYENWIKRLNAFGTYMDQTIALMREGIREGYVQPRVIMEKVSPQIAAHIVARPEDSPLYAPFRQFPDSVPEAQRAALAKAGADAIRTVVVPAFQRFQTFFNNEYLPASRTSIGASALPNGAAYYAWCARHQTTTTLTPTQIHQIGLDQVKLIRAQMDAVIRQVGFKGSFDDFSNFLRTDPRFFYKSSDELFEAYAALAKSIDGELPKLFGKLPRLPYGVREIPLDTAPYQTTAYYQPGAADGSRAGFLYVNVYKPETRPKWEMTALVSHEGVPGHHLQISLGQELPEAPAFRRFGDGYTAFHEGWAVYAETLGDRIGLYKDPYSKYGQLSFQMWRAVRLVVDTGIHAEGWTRDQAIQYFAENTPRPRNDIEVEVDRYIAWPGQALAYKIGQLKIQELRDKAQAALGERFDIRAFHDVVLSQGDIPLDVLERTVDDWIAEQQKKT